jgi:hypothetical protein
MRSNYGGGLGYGGAHGGISDGFMAAAVSKQQALAKATVAAWRADRRDALKKYEHLLDGVKTVSDSINDMHLNKRACSMRELTVLMDDQTREFHERADLANEFQKSLAEDYRQRMMKAGLTTTIGYNFYDLRGPAFLIYPVNVPFRNMMPRWGRTNAGYGTAAHWKYQGTSGPGTSYAGAAEGQRVATASPTEIDAIATYKELGIERSVTFTGEFAGEGYTDNVSDEHLRGLHELWLQEESQILFDNAGNGTGNNGFQLGQANTPTGVAVTGTGGFTNTHWISAYVVEGTPLGNPNNAQYGYLSAPTVTGGLTPTFTRTNADLSQNTITGGIGQISAGSTPVEALTATSFIKFTVAAKAGATWWAWFIDDETTNTSVAANAKLAAITTVPYYTAKADGTGTQAANFSGSGTDNSAQTLGMDGFFSWAVKNGVWVNMSDLTKTSPVTGATNNGLLNPGLSSGATSAPAVQEIEYDLQQQWNAYQTVATSLWCDMQTKLNISGAIFANSSGVPAYRFDVTRDSQGNILGGFVVSGYKNLYSMKATGSEELPLRIHPMFPTGTYLLDTETNPYPHSRIPGMRGLFVQREYYSIEWPLVTRTWTFGTYVHETPAFYMPGLLTIRTGITGIA